jgi:hypothetical protein
MSKNVLLGIAAFGGLVLIGILLTNTPNDTKAPVNNGQPMEVASLPENMPANIPIYPGAAVDSVNDYPGGENRNITLSLIAEASITEVNEWYREALSQNGWFIKSDKNVAGYQIIQGENANLYTSMQAANSGEAEKVRISQSVIIRKE